MNFEKALQNLKAGKLLTRAVWDQGVYLAIQFPTDKSKMTVPYFYLKNVHNDIVPVDVQAKDLLADDWMIMYGKKEEINFDETSDEKLVNMLCKKIPKEQRNKDTQKFISMMFDISLFAGESKKDAFESMIKAIESTNEDILKIKLK